MKVVIAAAGTGGHINPGIAIANKIKEENPKAKITFIGTYKGLENDLVPRAGYDLKRIEVYGISRSFSISNIKKMIKTTLAFGKAKKLIKELNPDIVIGTGGYICGPVILAAHKYKIPTILHESNAFPGMTVKLLSKKVNTILVGFKEAASALPKAKNVVVTGTPTKIKNVDISPAKKEEIKASLGIKSNKPMVLVFGGSQGAQRINETLMSIIENKLNTQYQFIWATGPKQYDIIKEEFDKKHQNINRIENTKIIPYIYNMEEIMNLCDLVICRSGAMTITEISMIGKPAIFIPLSTAAENHQEYNARVLVKVNAAKIVLDKELNAEDLNEMINSLIKNPEELKQMGQNAKKIIIYQVEDKIYEEIKKLV